MRALESFSNERRKQLVAEDRYTRCSTKPKKKQKKSRKKLEKEIMFSHLISFTMKYASFLFFFSLNVFGLPRRRQHNFCCCIYWDWKRRTQFVYIFNLTLESGEKCDQRKTSRKIYPKQLANFNCRGESPLKKNMQRIYFRWMCSGVKAEQSVQSQI